MTKLDQLAGHGQSVWLDFIRRSLINSGGLRDLVREGLRGVTSNPTIFHKAISQGSDYSAALERLAQEGTLVSDIYEALVIEDIQQAADLLFPVYDRTEGLDGYVSLEVNPHLAYDTEGTIMEARRLFAQVDRPNVMIKVPATPAGFPAIETLVGEGINVNVTLIFSLGQYEETARAYLTGLERLTEANVPLQRVASVASFFVSRVDALVDERLAAAGNTTLQGQIALANSKLAYARFQEIFSGPRWEKLAAQGARVQRPLWASTSTKNPAYSDVLYVENLIGPHTVNTMPPETLDAVRDHAKVAETVAEGLDTARNQIRQLADLGIDLDAVGEELQVAGVQSFRDSFDSLLQSIAEKSTALSGHRGKSLSDRFQCGLGAYQAVVDQALAEMVEAGVVSRIWAHSHTLWRPQPDEITNRLGWLTIAQRMRDDYLCIESLANEVNKEGYTRVIVLGMGGSSLAPELFGKTFRSVGIPLDVLDSTHPDAVAALDAGLDLARTLFVVSTKSGGTIETLSFFKLFYNRVMETVGEERAGDHFVAITDPGSLLVDLAKRYTFRATYLNDPNIGGRYSALSYFGLLPAGLTDVNLDRLLRRGVEAMAACGAHAAAPANPGAWLGAILGELAKVGRDKLTLFVSPGIASLADWLEQLVAESMGKEGKGILPVAHEPLPPFLDDYGDDRLFMYLRQGDDDTYGATIQALEQAGHPIVRIHLRDRYDLSEQFFLWEFAVAVAGHRMGINPFDQPNVESAKVQAAKMMAEYRAQGSLPSPKPALVDGSTGVFGDLQAENAGSALAGFLAQAAAGDYIALQAYVQPSAAVEDALQSLRAAILARYRRATTLGFGPRFLHSTGQLHKGDAGNGLFVQFTDEPNQDLPIPDEAGKSDAAVTFGVLIASQALGDGQALQAAGRRVLRLHLGADTAGTIRRLATALA